MIKHCPRCSNAVEMKTLESVSAEDAPLKLTATGMPVAKCAKGHAEQLRSAKQVQGHVAQAIAALNDAAGFPHSG